MALHITHDPLRQQRSPRRSPSAASASVAGSSDEELSKIIRSVRLDSATSDESGERDDWQPSQAIESDLSTIDFNKQAMSNSLAASRALTHVPNSIRAVSEQPFKQAKRHPLPVRPTQTLHNKGRPKLPERPAAACRAHEVNPWQAKDRRQDFETTWFAAPADNTLDDPTPGAWAWRDRVPSGWRQPKFRPSAKYEEAAARERLRPPTLGGKSKKDQLGSVNESWGPIDEEGEKVYGMFEIERDPPSRSTSPFKEESPRSKQEAVRAAKNEAYERGRQGMPWAGLTYAQQLPDRPQAGYVASQRTQGSTFGAYTPQNTGIQSSIAYGTRPSAFSSGYTLSPNDRYEQTPVTTASRDVFGPRRTFGQVRQ